jgi:hypothetical protein
VSLSPQVRVLAAAGFAAMLALMGGYMVLGHGQSASSAAVPVIKPLHPVKHHVVTTASPKKAVAKKVVAAKPVAKKVVPKKVAAKPVVVKTAAKPAPKPAAKPAAKPKVHVPAVIDGMPAALALALRAHAVVVVSLFTPGASVDAMATAEARQGAATAHTGFVAFSVADEKIVSPLTSLLTGAPTPADRVLDGPAVLVFLRPNRLFVRLNGFADRDTVAQAAANAATFAQ